MSSYQAFGNSDKFRRSAKSLRVKLERSRWSSSARLLAERKRNSCVTVRPCSTVTAEKFRSSGGHKRKENKPGKGKGVSEANQGGTKALLSNSMKSVQAFLSRQSPSWKFDAHRTSAHERRQQNENYLFSVYTHISPPSRALSSSIIENRQHRRLQQPHRSL